VAYRKLSEKWREAEAATLASLATLAAGKTETANLLGGNESQISEEQPPSNELPGKPVREVSEGGQADFHFRAGTPAKVAKVAKDARALAGLATLAATQARESHPAIPPNDPLSAALWSLETCPAYVPEGRWRQAIEDGQRFIGEWRNLALALGWTARDLFGLHTPPEKPHPSYRRLSRYAAGDGAAENRALLASRIGGMWRRALSPAGSDSCGSPRRRILNDRCAAVHDQIPG
jgi:hypothetical protein